MKTTKRFDEAVTKLYNAFNEGKLDAFDCTACAVGNMCDNSIEWVEGIWIGGNGRVSTTFKNKTGYSSNELKNVEYIFFYGIMPYSDKCHAFNQGKKNGRDEETQFKGLMAVINYLAELDGIEVPKITVEQFKEVLVGV